MSKKRSRDEKAGIATASRSGQLCVFAPLRDILSQKELDSRKGAKTQRNTEGSIAEKPRLNMAKEIKIRGVGSGTIGEYATLV
jgi:hypothetical protein